MKILGWAVAALLLTTGAANAVSIWELSDKCGDDAKLYCEGVGYGDAMQDCLQESYVKLVPQCKAVMDRINDGEPVTLL